MRIRSPWLAILAAISLFATSCSGPKFVPVTGTLTMNGKALKNVRVEFHPDPDSGSNGPSSSAVTDDNGNFTLACASHNNAPGAVVGHHRIILSDLDIYGTVFVGRGDYRSDDPKGPKEVPKIPRFSSNYSDLASTPFKQEVKANMSPVVLEVKK